MKMAIERTKDEEKGVLVQNVVPGEVFVSNDALYLRTSICGPNLIISPASQYTVPAINLENAQVSLFSVGARVHPRKAKLTVSE